jgi:Lipase (class 3)
MGHHTSCLLNLTMGIFGKAFASHLGALLFAAAPLAFGQETWNGDCPAGEEGTITSSTAETTPTGAISLSANEIMLTSKYGLTGLELKIVAREVSKEVSAITRSRYKVAADSARYALLSEAVYTLDVDPPGLDAIGETGWRVDRSLTLANASGFQGTVYTNDPIKEVVVAYAGTNERIADLLNDVKGGVWSDGQVGWAQALAAKARTKYGLRDYKLVVTGHSLGGRLAQLVASVEATSAFTFHAAAVSGTDFVKIGQPRASGIVNIATRHDPVNFARSKTIGTALNVGRTVCFDLGDRGGTRANHRMGELATSLVGMRKLYFDLLENKRSAQTTAESSVGKDAESSTTSAPTTTISGNWYSPEVKYGVEIKGKNGVLTISNLPSIRKVGEIALTITTFGSNSFEGEHFCSDGKFHPMHGTLGSDGRLYLTVQGCNPSTIYLVPAETTAGAVPQSSAPIAKTSLQQCYALIQDKIAWEYSGNTHWTDASIGDLCGNATMPTEPGACFNRVMHGGIDWGGSTQWQWAHASRLCAGATSAETTIKCFENRVAVGVDWSSAINECSGGKTPPPATIAQQCYSNIQGKIAWDYAGTKKWAPASVFDLCSATTAPQEPGICFNQVMHGGVEWGAGTRWTSAEATNLCRGTNNGSATVKCFQEKFVAGSEWQSAIATCKR